MATALRVIAHFDGLLSRGASTAAVLRATAALADTTVGLHESTTGRTTRVDAGGQPAPEPPSAPTPSWTRVAIGRAQAASVWLERDTGPGPLDQLILERCAQALRARLPSVDEQLSAQDLVRIACDPEVTERERTDALTALKITGPATVVVTPPALVPTAPARMLAGGSWVALLPSGAEPASVINLAGRAGSAVVTDGDIVRGHHNAVRALALAVHPRLGGPSHVQFEQLGGLAAIAAALTPSAAASTEEVMTLERLRLRRPWVPATLFRLWTEPSLRQAAKALHVHHSTLQDRVMWLEAELHYSPSSPDGRVRAADAWALWRISGHLQEPR